VDEGPGRVSGLAGMLIMPLGQARLDFRLDPFLFAINSSRP